MPEACYAYPNPIFQPAMRIIAAITQAPQASVTTTFDHLYIDGIIVRLVIPPGVGMSQVNGSTGAIVVTGPTTFTVAIDTTMADPFVLPDPPPQNYTCAQVIPIGEVNETLLAAVQNTLPSRSL